ncbi:unnamed protein product [Eruca vesicaria subsp. sativa]|uniref:Avr9/Cf-9 rapidly elicited protein n=1 Tax=Eruca vesicaria subsp. sativa TaxID=29727 RepID=A0ABC8LBP0_ERUVS|nr:unnamed protein product [Eruca vesicaria subsp. sativa]
MNSLLGMFDYFCAQMIRNKVTAVFSSDGSSSSSSSSAVQSVSVEKSTKNVSVEKAQLRFAPELDGLHYFETLIRS